MVPTPEVQTQLIDTRIGQGLTVLTAGHNAKAKEAIEPIVEIALKSSDKRWLGQIYFILGSYQYSIEEDLAPGFELLQKAIQNVDTTIDAQSAVLAHWFYGMALCWDCQFEKGAESIGKAIEIEEEIQRLWAISALNSYLSYFAHNYHGKMEEGFATSLKALEIAESSGDIYSRAVGFVCHGVSCFYKGFFATAEEHLLKGIDLCERIQLDSVSAIGHQGLGYTYFETENYDKSRIHYQKAILIRQQTGIFPSCINLYKIALARTALAAGVNRFAYAIVGPILETNKLKLFHGIMARYLADILFHLGEPHFAEAESWLRVAILDHEQHEMKWDLAYDYMIFSQFLKLQGRAAEEKGYSERSLSLFDECGAEGWRRKIETGCAEG